MTSKQENKGNRALSGVLNNRYKFHEGEGKAKEENSIMHKGFKIRGKPDFGLLEYLEGFKKIAPTLLEPEIPLTETIVYSSSSAIVIFYVNREADYQKVDISLKRYSEKNLEKIKEIQSKLERALEMPLSDREEALSDLTEKVGEN